MDDMNKEERVLIEELHQDLVLWAAKVGEIKSRKCLTDPALSQANIVLPEYVDSISSSDMSESKSNEDNEEHAPLILNDLLRINFKNLHYAVETVRLSAKMMEKLQQQPYKPYYYACRTSKSNRYGANSPLSYHIQRHDNHLHKAWHYEVLENGTIPAHVFHHIDNPLEYSIVEVFCGIRNNSPLNSEDNSLLSAGHALYNEVQGHDEWKIAILGVKIHRFMQTLEVSWDDWVNGDIQLPPDELDHIQQRIFLAHEGWHMPDAFEAWREDFEIRNAFNSCTEKCIMKPEEEDGLEVLIPQGIVFAKTGHLKSLLPAHPSCEDPSFVYQELYPVWG